MHIPDAELVHAPHAAHAASTIETVLSQAAVRMVFQPIVSLHNGDVVAFEALLRPKHTFANVADLLAEATRRNALPALDRLAHSLALASASYLPDHTRIFINASPDAIADTRFVSRISRLAELARIPTPRIVIEITELNATDSDDSLVSTARQLRSLGFGVAIDDVGAGQSDLGRILKLRPDCIKLDRALVHNLLSDHYCRSLVVALARFAEQTSIQVIAEGIELPSQARAVADLGVSLAQGFWFAQPVPIAEAISARCPDRVQRRWRSASAAA